MKDGYIGRYCRTHVKFIKPPLCERCGLPYNGDLDGGFTCANCGKERLYYRKARSVVVAQGMVLDLIHRYKYNHCTWLEPFLADLLVSHAEPLLREDHCDMIVPVPLHSSKQAERGFNQSLRLARHLGRATGLPVEHRAIRRSKPTKTQTHLPRKERFSNMHNSFTVRHPDVFRGRACLVFDDVLTTGATTNACAKALHKAGARDIIVWTLARGLMK